MGTVDDSLELVTREESLPPRFEVRRELGSGGFGAVFEAWDHERESLVAVKILRDFNARTLFRFKQEFRGLTGIVHPNLVTLYELLQDDGRWFFTMELIEGRDFLSFARVNPFDAMEGERSEGLAEQTTLDGLPPETDPYLGALDAPAPRVDAPGLRKALVELAHGLETLHLAGKLHCDVKPSNVLVTPEGRVVLLDFGLITERVEPEALRRLSQRSGGGHFFGTPHYMSPEQAKGDDLTPASDWYAVGVMLYEALTGVFPIDGNSTLQVLLRKQSKTPRPLLELNPDAPEDLAALCMAMLEREPRERAGALDVFELLGSGSSRRAHRSRSTSISFDQPSTFVGRRSEMRRMRDSVAQLASGQGGFINVSGRSGMGKTTLARAFLDSYVHPLENVIVLEGRCHENESVPFKVFDSLVDMLSRYLEHLPGDEVLGLVPHDVGALTRLFPTLSRIDALREASEGDTQLGSRQRERAFAALRDLLGELAQRHRLVLFVDDVQWGDEDSATLLEHLLRPPGQPQALVVMTFRSEDAEHNPFIGRLLEFQRDLDDPSRVVDVTLGELSPQEAATLARELLDSSHHADHVERLTREANGSPFLIDEFARHMRTSNAPLDGRGLEAVLEERVGSLTPAARTLLGVLGVAGHPLERRLARRVAGLSTDAQSAFATLNSELMVRVSSLREKTTLEPYHARIRDAAVAGLRPAERVDIHRRLATELSRGESPQHELVSTHLEAAGDRAGAAHWARLAADAARDVYAYGLAARLYQRVLTLGELDDDARRDLHSLVGELLGALGRAPEAVEAYERAAALAPDDQQRVYELRCVEQMLRAGYFEKGRARLDALLRDARLPVPRSNMRMISGFLMQRARLSLRGLAFAALGDVEIPPEERWRLELSWAAAMILSTNDIMGGAYYGLIHLRQALDAGDPTCISRALALEAMHAAGTPAGRTRSLQLIEAAGDLAPQTEDPSWSRGFVSAGHGMVSYLHGRWDEALEFMLEARRVLTEECNGVVWETDSAYIYSYLCHEQIGSIEPFVSELPLMIEGARARQDLHTFSMFVLMSYLGHLAHDDPDAARAALESGLASMPQRGFLLQHYRYMYGRCHTEIYAGRGLAAWDELERWWPELKKSLMLRIDCVRMLALDLRARCALAAYTSVAPAERRPYRKALDRACAALRREPLPHARAYADLLRAQRAIVDGHTEQGLAALEHAAAELDALGHRSRALSASLLAAATAGDLTRAQAVTTRLGELGPAEPERFARIWAPGLAPE